MGTKKVTVIEAGELVLIQTTARRVDKKITLLISWLPGKDIGKLKGTDLVDVCRKCGLEGEITNRALIVHLEPKQPIGSPTKFIKRLIAQIEGQLLKTTERPKTKRRVSKVEAEEFSGNIPTLWLGGGSHDVLPRQLLVDRYLYEQDE